MKLRKIANNMTVIELEHCNVLISYEIPVATYNKSTNKYKRTNKQWSATTTKHISSWLNGAETEVEPQSYFGDLLNVVNT